ncbi:MAG: ribosome silencing factor [Planctomycetota bacterium]
MTDQHTTPNPKSNTQPTPSTGQQVDPSEAAEAVSRRAMPASPAKPAKPTDEQTKAMAIDIARLMSDLKCTEVVALDLLGRSPLADVIIIATGTSDRQMRSAIDDVAELGASKDFPVLRKSEDDRATWIVADLGTIVAHVFEPNTRAHYDLELLWGDSERIDWQTGRPAAAPINT